MRGACATITHQRGVEVTLNPPNSLRLGLAVAAARCSPDTKYHENNFFPLGESVKDYESIIFLFGPQCGN
ncbi:hypothetical protein M378DRAFT_163706, partial [Amanita muscaria Koide BX008]